MKMGMMILFIFKTVAVSSKANVNNEQDFRNVLPLKGCQMLSLSSPFLIKGMHMSRCF